MVSQVREGVKARQRTLAICTFGEHAYNLHDGDCQMSDASQVAELLRRGIAAAKAGRKQKARQALLRVTELDERSEQAWLWLSGVVESLEDRRACLENVLAINPENPHAQAGLRWLDQQTPASTVAQERCPRCGSPVPLAGETCPRCGQVLVVACPGCGEYVDVSEPACPACGQSLGDFRDGALYHLGLAEAYVEHHRHALAQEAISRAEAEAPGDPHVTKGTAALYEKMGHTDRAIAIYQQAIERAPGDAELYASLGAIYRRRTMPAEARATYEQALGRAGDDSTVLFELAQMRLEDEGTTPEVLDLLERTVRSDPAHAQAHLLLGDLYLGQRQGPQATQHYERACKLTAPDSHLGREARRKSARLLPPTPGRESQGWGETVRRMGGLMLIPTLAAMVNARLVPWAISLAAWGTLVVAGAGAYLWVCATDVPRNPGMQAIFGEGGAKGLWRQTLVGLPGVLLWCAALGLILWKV
jgi:tetratricopeptide (TPR) repeat protein